MKKDLLKRLKYWIVDQQGERIAGFEEEYERNVCVDYLNSQGFDNGNLTCVND